MPITLDLRQNFAEPLTAEYAITDEMLASVENTLVKGGQLTASVTALKAPEGLRLTVRTAGKAVVECDRCLDDMEVDIDTVNTLTVQTADRFEDADDIIYVEKTQKELDLWPMVYDFIALALPVSHVHPEGQCNKEMAERLSRYMVQQPDDDTETN
ncbi:MAG: DUF177 domain-containing protein [Bacteroidaceae bacterium]|nr:DUF177 domain-containing protein [Bacteroidaceae bacterium]